LFQAGTRGLKRDLIIRLETSALTPEKGEIIHYYAVNRWDEDDEFDEWAKPLVALSAEAEAIIGVTNASLSSLPIYRNLYRKGRIERGLRPTSLLAQTRVSEHLIQDQIKGL
jgi:hypothetical protein